MDYCKFTFQYGWIYKLKLQDERPDAFADLHSNMGGFIRYKNQTTEMRSEKFTFQYGWIYKHSQLKEILQQYNIYIPIWVDL